MYIRRSDVSVPAGSGRHSLRADIKREVKVHLFYSLDVTYHKVLDYEKYLRVVLMHVPFSPDTHPSRPITLPRSHPNNKPVNTISPLGLLLMPLPLAWLRL